MNCPIDGTTLVMSDRQGVEIDYCPKCRGVWLDRGEIDKIVERSTMSSHGSATSHESIDKQPRQPHFDNDELNEYAPPGRGDYTHHKKRKKESFLGELFDF